MSENVKNDSEFNEEMDATTSYSSQLDEAEKMIESTEDDSDEHDDYSELSKEEIIQKAESLLHAANIKKAQESLNNLRDALELIEQDERPAQIKEWTDQGNDPRDFKPTADEFRNKFNRVVNQFREKREEERKRAEEEKLTNLKLRETVLEKMKNLLLSEETEDSLKTMRELMREWREIRQVPKEFQDDLYKRYRFYVDKFYDNLSIFHELKELDREKNLEVKIDLIKKVEGLKEEKNLRKALVTLNKYHEDWRNAGPVRREISEEIWNRFKAASDSLLAEKKAIQDEMDKQKIENLKLKELLIEKAEAAISVLPNKAKDWSQLGKELDQLLNDWKKIGPVPREVNQEVWSRFRGARSVFFNGRREFFKDLNASKEENLKAKIALCEEAESLKDLEDFNSTTEKFNQLQDQWKKTGPVPESKNDEIWKRFRASFDYFYNRKNAFFEARRSQEKDAVAEKDAIIKELMALKDETDGNAVFQKLKDAQTRWAKSGFVSGKTYYNLQKKYQEISDVLFAKFKQSNESMKDGLLKEHYDLIANAPDGGHRIQGEERKMRDRINKLEEEVSTIENNKSFFAHSKNAEAVLKQFDDNIRKIKLQIEKLQKELKVIRSFKNQNAK